MSRPSSHSSSIQHSQENIVDQNQNHLHLRKSKCLACSPHIFTFKSDDSERIPWEEPKMWSKTMGRERSKSLPVIDIKTCDKTITNGDSKKCASSKARSGKELKIPKVQKQFSLDNDRNKSDNAQKLVISSGSLKLCVKFPSDSHIMIKNGVTEKTVFGNQHF